MNVIDGIRKNSFLVVGRAGMDLSPEPAGTKTAAAGRFIAGLGGSSANIAAGISKFGGRTALLTRVSDDPIGRFCLNQLASYGIDTTHVTPVGGEYRNSLAIYESVLQGHETVIYRNGAADFQMSVEDVEAVDYSAYGALITAGTVFAAEPSRTASFRAFELARAAGLPIIFDVDYRPYSWPSAKVAEEVLSKAGSMADVIVGNDEEFGFMAGDIAKGMDLARHYVETQAEFVIYKKGPEGATTFYREQSGKIGELHTGIFKVEALKPTGAGDSFMAGLMSSLAAGFDLRTAIIRGSACAAITVSKPLCAPAMPDKAELDKFLASRPETLEA